LGLVGYFIFANVINKPKTNLPLTKITGGSWDFGDAPDGKQTSYEESFAQIGQFPSLLSSDGARTKKTDDVWLGQEVTSEIDAREVNVDEADDGIRGTATSCKQSTTYFFIRIKNPGQMTGTAYLNLYADWNKDGKWSGSDECAPERAVQNFPVDLSKQTEEIAVYEVTFTAGKNTDKIWYRGAVTLGEKMNESATGEFKSGEIEDFGPYKPLLPDEKYYNFFCQPDPLIISHGSSGGVQIVADWGSEPIFDVQFGQNYQPKNEKRQVTIGNNNTFLFESTNKDVNPPKRNVPHFVSLKVRFGADGKEATMEKACRVIVKHDELPKNPVKKGIPVPSEAPNIETESGGSTKTETHPIQEGAPAL
ncbi:MAG: hypothetical protein HYT09_00795, partial [Candidatus Levybacteria bacterium]|nr:hypothetical protein [Candidatus Levybacteria bacterium]